LDKLKATAKKRAALYSVGAEISLIRTVTLLQPWP